MLHLWPAPCITWGLDLLTLDRLNRDKQLFFLSQVSASTHPRGSPGVREHGWECEKVLRPDSQAAVWRKLQFLCAEGESCPHWECGVSLRNNDQGLHSDERASQPLLRQGTRRSGCALQSVWTSGRPCVSSKVADIYCVFPWEDIVYMCRMQSDMSGTLKQLKCVLLGHHATEQKPNVCCHFMP